MSDSSAEAVDRARMAAEVRAGLSRRPLPELPSKYFYDDRGSDLFEQITRLPEYYQTRTEERLLDEIAMSVTRAVRPREVCELGSGASRKLRRVIEAGRALGTLEQCTLLDISANVLRASVALLELDYPGLRVRGVPGDFLRDLEALGPGGGRLVLFLGGTIGNLHPDHEVPGFLGAVARQLAPGDALLVGLDLVKDERRLHAAYNDAAGVTAEFNRNILNVVNARLGADFEPAAFDHVAFYDPGPAWIEMRLRARRDMHVRIPAAELTLDLRRGAEIRTEISCKYTRQTFDARLHATGLTLEAWHADSEALFAAALLRRAA